MFGSLRAVSSWLTVLGPRLHYVRSHGAVPQLSWETHTLEVFADPPELMAKPKHWTMDELSDGDFRVYELPVTFGCDGSGSLGPSSFFPGCR